MRVTATGSSVCFGAFVTKTTRPWYSPGARFAVPRWRVTVWEPLMSTVPDSGDSLSHGASVNGWIVPWPESGAQSDGPS